MSPTRRLAAIMFTDMVGSTAAAQTDEAEALKLRDEQATIVRSLLLAHQGREVKTMGDGFLAEFDSALRAVQCSVEIQQGVRERNSRAGQTPITLRIGIHLGDVEQRDTDIFGDAVNIASRIEPVADPGGVCISGAVREQVWNKIPERLEKLPPRELKGLQVALEIYRVIIPPPATSTLSNGTVPGGIAILPFTNISPDPNDEYFADGLTEEMISVLSQLRGLRVISRTSVMQYKGTPKPVGQIGTELGVTSVLEGSVRKAGNRLRITAQLIDAGTDRHLWTKTYDRELDDVFAVQSEIAKRVAEALEVELHASDSARLETRPTVSPGSYLAYLRGRTLFTDRWAEENLQGAKKLFEEALAIDPSNARAHSGLADVTRYIHYLGYAGSEPDWDRTSRIHAARAIEIDPYLAEGHCSLGSILWDDFEYVGAEKEMQLALTLNPSYSQAHHWFAAMLMDQARSEEALREASLAEQLDPQSMTAVVSHLQALIVFRRLDDVPPMLQRLKEIDREGPHYFQAVSYYHYARGEFEAASRAVDRVDALDSTQALTDRAWILAATGEVDKARRLVKEREAMAEPIGRSALAAAYAVTGDLDAAFDRLNAAIDEHNVSFLYIRNEPTLEPMRQDPRFAVVLKRMNLA